MRGADSNGVFPFSSKCHIGSCARVAPVPQNYCTMRQTASAKLGVTGQVVQSRAGVTSQHAHRSQSHTDIRSNRNPCRPQRTYRRMIQSYKPGFSASLQIVSASSPFACNIRRLRPRSNSDWLLRNQFLVGRFVPSELHE